MGETSAMPTPMISSLQLLTTSSEEFENPRLYRSVVGSLHYLIITTSDISFVVSKVSQFMHKPLLAHWKALKRVLRYLRGIKQQGLLFHKNTEFRLYGFADADWASNLEDCRKQITVSRSSTEAEFRSLAAHVAKTVWIKNLLLEFKVQLQTSPTIFCDNLSTVIPPIQCYMTKLSTSNLIYSLFETISKAMN
ncbi:uncharacterized protein LOC107633405 [Arachis ipaensis]|uniref:uncharacterized protein LOC107633405 n=1 Tax=Arachis ipaensis TaxID=130454 RepID=UPI0007AFB3DD|nr:uncharacterized protein LOC107633405 [Arachis ipaensis]